MVSSVRTLMFSDVEGSTSLLRRAGADYPGLLNVHREIVRRAVEAHDGVEHGTEGDSFFVSFDSPSAALAAAVQAQLGLESHPWPPELRLRVRMGVHLGEVSPNDGGLVGLAVHHAARIASTAHGGQIVASDAVRDAAVSLPAAVTWQPLGARRLRDVGTVVLHQVLHPELQQSFPELRGVLGRTVNLPSVNTTFVGGDELLGTVTALMGRGRVVTLTGTGGVGKTRAAVEWAWRHVEEFEDGVHFVDLAAVVDGSSVAAGLAAAVQLVSPGSGSLLEGLVDWVGGKRILLVFDNCEHVVADVSTVVAALVAGCPAVRVLTTSREPLGVEGEQVHRVSSLAASGAAVDLFCARATSVNPSFARDDWGSVLADICERVDGIPLAIELAAARMSSLSPVELLDRLHDRFRMLRGSGRGRLDRHQTLRATVSWSYQLLSADEQRLFDRLAVFAGGFDLAAAEAVCGTDPIDELDVLDLLGSLVDKSMVLAVHRPGGTRYRLLETLRQFAEERLEGSEDGGSMRDRHARHYARLATVTDAVVRGRQSAVGHQTMAAEWDNLRAAHLWALAQDDLPLAEAIVEHTLFHAQSRFRHEHAEWARQTVELGEALGRPSTLMMGMLALWLNQQGDEAENVVVARRGLEVAPSPHDPSAGLCWFELAGASYLSSAGSDEVLAAFRNLEACVANIADLRSDWSLLVDLVDSSLWANPSATPALRRQLSELAAEVGAPLLVSHAALYEGHSRLQGDPPDFAAALPWYERALDATRGGGEVQNEGIALRAIALATVGLGAGDAPARCADAIEVLYEIRYWQKLWQALDCACLALAHAGRREALAVFGHLEAHMPSVGLERSLGYRDRVRALVDGWPDAAAAMDRGARLSRDEIVALALAACRDAAV